MFTRQEFKDVFSEEIRVIRHLGTKIEPKILDWRPGANQRSTLELLRYLARCGIGPARAIERNDWKETFQEIVARSEKVDLAGFDAAMALQETELHALLDGLSESDLTERDASLPFGMETKLGMALYLFPARFLNAYRMQLFLYLKQTGRAELDTFNAWRGMDRPAEPAQAS